VIFIIQEIGIIL